VYRDGYGTNTCGMKYVATAGAAAARCTRTSNTTSGGNAEKWRWHAISTSPRSRFERREVLLEDHGAALRAHDDLDALGGREIEAG
jgi:hypothetical protein